jgi:ribosomal protein S18 acetylase RimI-like enzyme
VADHSGPQGPSIRTDADVDAVAALLSDRLYAFNVEATGHTDGQRFAFTVRDDDTRDVVAAVVGWTWGGCGYVDQLWVRADRRGQGLGTALLDRAEESARAAGCDQVVLTTHTFQAPDLYRARGYRVLGEIPGYPRGHAQLILAKPLTTP